MSVNMTMVNHFRESGKCRAVYNVGILMYLFYLYNIHHLRELAVSKSFDIANLQAP